MNKVRTLIDAILSSTTLTVREMESRINMIEVGGDPAIANIRQEINVVAREWVKTHRAVSKLQQGIASIATTRKEFASKLTPVVEEISSQKVRVHEAIIGLQSKECASYNKTCDEAVALLKSVDKVMMAKSREFMEQATVLSTYLKTETKLAVLVQNFVAEVWSWLRGMDEIITQIEQIVFYGE